MIFWLHCWSTFRGPLGYVAFRRRRTTDRLLASAISGTSASAALPASGQPRALGRGDRREDRRSSRSHGVRRIGVRPADDAALVDKDERGNGDDVVGLARGALEVDAVVAQHLELLALDLVDDVEGLDERQITVAEDGEGNGIGGIRLRRFLRLLDADRDGGDAALLVLGERGRQCADLEVAVRAPPP